MPRFYQRPELVARRRQWKDENQRVVFTNGCYDILHPGHIRLLERARSLGDILILGLNTDASVQRMKGPSRPFFNEQQRIRLALQLEAVDAITLFDEATPRELIAAVLPIGRTSLRAARKWRRRVDRCWLCRSSPAIPQRTWRPRFWSGIDRRRRRNSSSRDSPGNS
jgi:cytidyltransferase-like protein